MVRNKITSLFIISINNLHNDVNSLILQVWRVSGQEKHLLPVSDQSKFYTGDCYIFQYSYAGDDKEEYLVGTWFGKQSVEVVDFSVPNSLHSPPGASIPLCGQIKTDHIRLG